MRRSWGCGCPLGTANLPRAWAPSGGQPHPWLHSTLILVSSHLPSPQSFKAKEWNCKRSPPCRDQAALATTTGGHQPPPSLSPPLSILRGLWPRPGPAAGDFLPLSCPVSTGTFSRLRRCPTLTNVMPSCWPMRSSSLSTSSVRALVASSSTEGGTRWEKMESCPCLHLLLLQPTLASGWDPGAGCKLSGLWEPCLRETMGQRSRGQAPSWKRLASSRTKPLSFLDQHQTLPSTTQSRKSWFPQGCQSTPVIPLPGTAGGMAVHGSQSIISHNITSPLKAAPAAESL